MDNSCNFIVVARDDRAIRHEAAWETAYRPQIGETLILPAPQGSTWPWTIVDIQHGVTGKLFVQIDVLGLPPDLVKEHFGEIRAEHSVSL